MAVSESRFRISIDVDEDLYRRAYKVLEWGERNRLLRVVLEQVVEAIERGGPFATYCITQKKIPLFGGREIPSERIGD